MRTRRHWIAIVGLLIFVTTVTLLITVIAVEFEWPSEAQTWYDSLPGSARPRGDEVKVPWPPSPNAAREPVGPSVRLEVRLPEVLSADGALRAMGYDDEFSTGIAFESRDIASVELVNQSDQILSVVMPEANSGTGSRTPFIAWLVEPVREGAHTTPGRVFGHYLGCGFGPQTLETGEVTIVSPGHRLRFGCNLGRIEFPNYGVYRVTFAYANVPLATWYGMARYDQAFVDRVRESTEIVAYSEPMLITIEP